MAAVGVQPIPAAAEVIKSHARRFGDGGRPVSGWQPGVRFRCGMGCSLADEAAARPFPGRAAALVGHSGREVRAQTRSTARSGVQVGRLPQAAARSDREGHRAGDRSDRVLQGAGQPL
ncbi:hypothetical protein EEZ25_27975 [Micromonospora aurantiaca]|nr:hypothetical protein EEZ25_27975 [Micromonospora aurantiaca]